MLRLDGIEVAYGEMQAVRGVSLEVREGEIVSVIGSNGAGKTTTLRAVSGLLPLRAGRIHLDGQRIDGQSPAAIVERGIGHVPEGRQLFPSLSVLENLEMGARTARATSRRFRSAKVRLPARACALAARPTWTITARALSSASRPCRWRARAPTFTLSSTERCGKGRTIWKVRARPTRQMA